MYNVTDITELNCPTSYLLLLVLSSLSLSLHLLFFVTPLDLGAALDAKTFVFLTVFFVTFLVMTVFLTPFNGFLALVSAFFFAATLITLGILFCCFGFDVN